MNTYASVNYQKCCKYIDAEILFLNAFNAYDEIIATVRTGSRFLYK